MFLGIFEKVLDFLFENIREKLKIAREREVPLNCPNPSQNRNKNKNKKQPHNI